MTLQLIRQLFDLGVRKVTLTPEAARALCQTFQGKYINGDIHSENLGTVLGIEFEREHGAPVHRI